MTWILSQLLLTTLLQIQPIGDFMTYFLTTQHNTFTFFILCMKRVVLIT